MRLNCMSVEEAIWDWARDGVELSAEVGNHIRQCGSCAEALADVKLSLEALRCAEPYPPAPDCREQVLARIATRRTVAPVWRHAWAAALVLVVALMTVTFYPAGRRDTEPPQTPRQAVVHQKPAPPPEQPKLAARPNLAEAPRTAAVSVKPVPAHRRRPASHSAKSIVVRVPEAAHAPSGVPGSSEGSAGARVEHVAAATAPEAGDEVGDDESIVKAVSIAWSAESDTSELSYHYSEKDDASGTVTTGSVLRRGDTIEIRLESAPASTALPTKGEITSEANPSV